MIKKFLNLILFLFTLNYTSMVYANNNTILVFGDSLSAGYGILTSQSWVKLLEDKLKTEKLDYNVINASISGETTMGGRIRMMNALKQHQPKIVIIELGANDGLRGLPIEDMKANLNTMIHDAKQSKATVLLVGMKLPPNYGVSYTKQFEQVYSDLKQQQKIQLVPFMFEGLLQNRDFFQIDNLHPTAKAQPIILNTIWKQLQPMLKSSK